MDGEPVHDGDTPENYDHQHQMSEGEPEVAPEAGLLNTDSLLLTAIQAAELLCISEATLWELVKRDRLRCVQFVATGFRRPMRRFRMQDLIRFIEDAVE